MTPQGTVTQAKGTKRYAETIMLPETKAEIFRDVARKRRIRKISHSRRIDCAAIEEVIADGIREMRAVAPLPRFRENRDGWGKRKPVGSVVQMPSRVSGVAA